MGIISEMQNIMFVENYTIYAYNFYITVTLSETFAGKYYDTK